MTAGFDGVIAVVVTYHSPEYHPSYGHKTRYLWPQAVAAEFARWKNKKYDAQGRLVEASQYWKLDFESRVVTIKYVALEGDQWATPIGGEDE